MGKDIEIRPQDDVVSFSVDSLTPAKFARIQEILAAPEPPEPSEPSAFIIYTTDNTPEPVIPAAVAVEDGRRLGTEAFHLDQLHGKIRKTVAFSEAVIQTMAEDADVKRRVEEATEKGEESKSKGPIRRIFSKKRQKNDEGEKYVREGFICDEDRNPLCAYKIGYYIEGKGEDRKVVPDFYRQGLTKGNEAESHLGLKVNFKSGAIDEVRIGFNSGMFSRKETDGLAPSFTIDREDMPILYESDIATLVGGNNLWSKIEFSLGESEQTPIVKFEGRHSRSEHRFDGLKNIFDAGSDVHEMSGESGRYIMGKLIKIDPDRYCALLGQTLGLIPAKKV